MRHPGLLVRLLLGTLLLAAPALLNRQPLLYEDIFAYLRGPAVISLQLGGPRFENAWSKVHRPLAAPAPAAAEAPAVAPEAPAAQQDRSIEAGRSIYWGTLAYLTWLASGFWLLVVLQAAIVAWLLDLLLLRCLRLGTAWYAGALVGLTLLTPLPYYVAYVMPDLFAAVAILGAALLVGFWRDLARTDRVLLWLLVAFGVMAHASHLLTLAAILVVCAVAALLRRTPAPRAAPLLALAACVALGALGEVAFGQAVRLALHQSPLRLPHMTAHLIEMGPGLDLLRAQCGGASPFALCAYVDRLPVDWVSFLFDSDPARGVFGAADMVLKRRISEEQTRFLLATLAHDPLGTATGLLRDGLEQVVSFGLPDIVYTQKRLDFFAGYFPAALAEGAPRTLVQTHPAITRVHEAIIYAVALAALLAGGIALLRPGPARRDPAWDGAATVALVVLLGLVVNGLVCGMLASPYGRFEARVIWLLPLVAMALVGLRLRAGARQAVAAGAQAA
ncbi:hypothetical protein [Paracraurococcus lichenis]|uniref:Glycosyltransferase RgtA/B/C/D-like domain-containing protein n=1 Tax=Paracraurococcus lichenis TaxID=3064888 RepID=A0ABT9DVC7_9PROT|nr:hypothetical protein [Paracraurococcus sp. LOR1-02]MDO9707855.1 hypothetical protein [Paracraurococcus sp. LOR1-02]